MPTDSHTPTTAPNPKTTSTDSEVADQTEDTGPLASDHGSTTIADVVVEKIAGVAAGEVPGVHKLGGGAARAIGSMRERIPGQKASIGQGVAVAVGQRQAAVDLVIVVEFGVPITKVADTVREDVIAAIEEMTGLEVTEVNIAVDDIHLPDEADDDDDTSDEARVQ